MKKSTITLYNSLGSPKGAPKVIDYGTPNLLRRVNNLGKKVIYKDNIQVTFDYPLKSEVIIKYEKKGGFTMLDLFRFIYSGYKKIYEDEKKYGVCLHYIDDLFIEGIYYDENRNMIELEIGS